MPSETPDTIGGVGAGTFWFDTAGLERLPAFTRRPTPGSTVASRGRTIRTWTSRLPSASRSEET